MSWIFGFVGSSISDSLCEKFGSIHSVLLQISQNEKMYVTAGGLNETCLYGKFADSVNLGERGGWIVVGLGIRLNSDTCSFLYQIDWEEILSSPKPNLKKLYGHFVVIRWEENKLEVFNDQLGLRTFYFLKYQNGIAFSTRLIG